MHALFEAKEAARGESQKLMLRIECAWTPESFKLLALGPAAIYICEEEGATYDTDIWRTQMVA